MASEQDKADLAKKRGQAAAMISDAEQRRKFIAAQGEAETKGKLNDTEAANQNREAEDTIASQGENKNSGIRSQGIASYAKGTAHVPKTGVAKLHKGEMVIPKEKAAIFRGLVNELANQDESPSKELREIRIRKGAKGYIAEHHHKNMEHPMEEHALSSHKEMMDHVAQHMAEEPDSDDMPSYKNGTINVPNVGKAVLHEGEMVVPKVAADAIRTVTGTTMNKAKGNPLPEKDTTPPRVPVLKSGANWMRK